MIRIFVWLTTLLLPGILPLAFGDGPRLERAGVADGFRFAATEQWGVIGTTVANPTDQPVRLLVSTFFNQSDISNVQFARDVWIPARSRRVATIPYRAPEFSRTDPPRGLEITTRLLDPTRKTGDFRHDEGMGLIGVDAEDTVFSVLRGQHDQFDDADTELVAALKANMNLSKRIYIRPVHEAPSLTAAWDSVSCVVLSGRDIRMDSAQITAMRQWLVSGGRLWIMLDRTDRDFCARLLGNDLQLQVIDELPMTSFDILGRNVFADGGMTIRDGNKATPKGWAIPSNMESHVKVESGGTRIDSESISASAAISHKIDIDRHWSTLLLSARIRTQNLDVSDQTYGGAQVRITFHNVAGEALGDHVTLDPDDISRVEQLAGNGPPPADVAEGKTTPVGGWTTAWRTVAVPEGAASALIETGLYRAKGSMWVNQIELLPRQLRFESPVPMLRTVSHGMDVLRSYQGWPIALGAQVGEGYALITTVGPRFWTTEAIVNPESISDFGRSFVRRRRVESLDAPELMPFVKQEIGHDIMSRSPVLVLLSGFAIAMLLGGFWLARSDRLEYIAPAGVGLSLLVTVILLMMGKLHHGETPLTIAGAQFVQVIPSQQQAVVEGLVSVYSPTADQGPLKAVAGGVVWPDRTGQEGRLLRMVWTDMDRWMWDMLELPAAAVRTAELKHVADMPTWVGVKATFNSEGLVGQIEAGPFTNLKDIVLAGTNGHMVPRMLGEGAFVAGAREASVAGQYFAGGSITDLQQRRQVIFDKLLSKQIGQTEGRYPGKATLLMWGDAMDLGFTLPQNFVRRESAIIAVPLTFERPESGTRIAIPPQVIGFESVRGPGRASVATIYNNLSRQWIGQFTNSTTFTMAFQVPQQVLPMKVNSARMDVRITAPTRSLEIIDEKSGRVIHSATDLMREASFELLDGDSASAYAPNADGVIFVTFRVTDPPPTTSPLTPPAWEITGMELNITGTVE